MENLLHNKWTFLGCIILFMGQPNNIFGQSVKRQCIASYGNVVMSDNMFTRQTGGQCYNTTSKSEDNITVLQGFQQPGSFIVEEIATPALSSLNLKVYPNPASSVITIQSNEDIAQSFISVSDINGRRILSERVPNLQSHNINCESWANGIYFISIHDNNKNRKTLKLVISK